MAAKSKQLGDLNLTRALEMVMEFDPLMFFPTTTQADWEPHLDWLKPNALSPTTGMLQFPCQSYIVRTSHHVILIDSCVGNHKDRPNRSAWHEKTDTQYMDALASHGLAPEDIDYVMCTHMHGDHIGWNTRLDNGQWVPTFPNARYIFSQKELEAWQTNEDERFSAVPLQDSVLPIVAAGRADLVANDFALDDEVWVQPTPGHTPDHLAVNLASKGERAIMIGDMMHSPVQCRHPDWEAWPDWDAGLAAKTRRSMMEELSESQTLVLTAHFPLPSAGWFRRDGDMFAFDYVKENW